MAITYVEDPGESIVARTIRGQRTMLFSHAVRVLCKILSVLLLARLVGPEDQGLYAMVASLTLLLTIFRDLGVGVAAVQAGTLSEESRTTLWWFHVALGLVLAGALLALIPALVWFYGEPRLAPLAACVSVSFVFIGLSAWPRVLLARELHFTAINRAETLAVVLATAAMLLAGACGWGAYAFACFLIVVEAVTVVASWRACTWRPHGTVGWQHLGPFLRTGLDVTGHNLVLHVSQQLDTLLVGKWFGPHTLGLYFRSAQMFQMPALHVGTPLAQVMLASLSRIGVAAPEFRAQVRSTANLVLHLTLPPAILCFLLPRDITLLVLGPTWLEAAPFVRWMACSAGIAAMTATSYGLCVATGHTRRLAGLAFVSLAANLVTLWLARPFGAAQIALALAVANGVLLLPRLWWVTRATPVRLADFAAAFAGPVAVAATLALGICGSAFIGSHENGALRLATALAGGLTAVALLCTRWDLPRRELREVWSHRPRWGTLFAAASVKTAS